MKLKITFDGGPSYMTRIVNAETGELLEGVTAVRWEVPEGGFYQEPICTLTLQRVPVEITATARVLTEKCEAPHV